jgi:hypothetical protein
MNNEIIEFIQKPLKSNMYIVEHSIPVLFFGDIENATCATFGINPSKVEFLTKDDILLSDKDKRFVDRFILNVDDMEHLSINDASKVYKSLIEYFDEGHNPYSKWFNVLNNLFSGLGFSYYERSLVHLDITPWATNPTWNRLNKKVQELLIHEGIGCLKIILESTNIKTIFINGRSPMKYIENNICKMKFVENLKIGSISCDIKIGNYGNRTFLGWSTNLQSSYGVSNVFKSALEKKIQTILNDA